MRHHFALLLALLLPVWPAIAAPTVEQGYDAYEQGDFVAAAQIWRTLAAAGGATAQLNLGQLYRLGQGVEASDAQAVKWYAQAAKQGSEVAKYNLLLLGREGRAPDYWLLQLEGDDYLVQLLAQSNRSGLVEFAKKHLADIKPAPQVILTRSKGHDWYVLLWGPFDSKERAKKMLATLPPGIQKNKLWVRSASSIPAPLPRQR